MLDIYNCLWLSILQLFEVILKIDAGQCPFNKPIKLQDLQVHGCSKARLSEWGIQVLATQRIRISQYLFTWPKYLVKFCWIAVLSMASTIIADNATYQSHLDQFLAPAVGNDPKWLLCYRASSHGWDVSNFHNRCDGKNHTVTIIKVGVYVFGGYTDIPWGNYNYSVLYWLTLRAQWQLDTRVTFQRVRPFSLSLECSFSSTIIERKDRLLALYKKYPHPPPPSKQLLTSSKTQSTHTILHAFAQLSVHWQNDFSVIYTAAIIENKSIEFIQFTIVHACFLKPTRPRL